MSPSVVYALLWLWVVDPNERGLLNQILVHVLGMPPIDLRANQPLLLIILANGFIGASLGMIIFTSAIRSNCRCGPPACWPAAASLAPGR